MTSLPDELRRLAGEVTLYERHAIEATFGNGQAAARHRHAIACNSLARVLIRNVATIIAALEANPTPGNGATEGTDQ